MLKATKLVSQDWGQIVVGRSCGAVFKQPNLSARIGVTSLLVGVAAPC